MVNFEIIFICQCCVLNAYLMYSEGLFVSEEKFFETISYISAFSSEQISGLMDQIVLDKFGKKHLLMVADFYCYSFLSSNVKYLNLDQLWIDWL